MTTNKSLGIDIDIEEVGLRSSKNLDNKVPRIFFFFGWGMGEGGGGEWRGVEGSGGGARFPLKQQTAFVIIGNHNISTLTLFQKNLTT